MTATLVLIGLRQAVRWAILHEIDVILEEDAEEIRLALADLAPSELSTLYEELNRKAMGHRQHGWFATLFASDGAVVWTSRSPSDPAPSPLPRELNEPATLDHKRLVQRDVVQTPNAVTVIQVGGDLSFLDEDMRRIDRLMFVAVAALVIIAPLIGYWLARSAAATVGEMIQTARTLEPARLNDRLIVSGNGDELDSLATTINGLLDRLAAFVAQRRDFLAHAAHELRSPLAAIRSSIEVTLDSSTRDDTETEFLTDLIEEVTTLETLVNQLLLISESEAERLKVDQAACSLSELIQKSVDMFAGVAELADIKLVTKIDPDIHCSGNRHLLRQLANNLIDNAIKYTRTGGEVLISLSHDERPTDGTGYAQLAVQDTGIGIDADDVSKVFDRFFRADRVRTRMADKSGTGLGLSICRAVVEAHGGTITCESELGKGTLFLCTLPLSR